MTTKIDNKKLKRISATKARNNFFGIVQDAYLTKSPYLIEKDGIPMAYIMPFREDDVFQDDALTERQKEQLALLDELSEFRKKQKVSSENSTDLIRRLRLERSKPWNER